MKNLDVEVLGNKVRGGSPVDSGFSLADVDEALSARAGELDADAFNFELGQGADLSIDPSSNSTPLKDITVGVEKAGGLGKTLNMKLSEFDKSFKDDMTVGQMLGLQAASAGLQTLGGIQNINDATSDRLDVMKDEFDMAFGANEFVGRRRDMAQEQQAVDDIMNQLAELEKLDQIASTQTLSNQRQLFPRNTNTGGRV